MSNRSSPLSSKHIVVRPGKWLSKEKQRVQCPRVPVSKIQRKRTSASSGRKYDNKQRSIFSLVQKTCVSLKDENNRSITNATTSPPIKSLKSNKENASPDLSSSPSCRPYSISDACNTLIETKNHDRSKKNLFLADPNPRECTMFSELLPTQHLQTNIISNDAPLSLNDASEHRFNPLKTSTQIFELTIPSQSYSHEEYSTSVCGKTVPSIYLPSDEVACNNLKETKNHNRLEKPLLVNNDATLSWDESITSEHSLPFLSFFDPLKTSTQVSSLPTRGNSQDDYNLNVCFTQDSQGNKIFARLSPKK